MTKTTRIAVLLAIIAALTVSVFAVGPGKIVLSGSYFTGNAKVTDVETNYEFLKGNSDGFTLEANYNYPIPGLEQVSVEAGVRYTIGPALGHDGHVEDAYSKFGLDVSAFYNFNDKISVGAGIIPDGNYRIIGRYGIGKGFVELTYADQHDFVKWYGKEIKREVKGSANYFTIGYGITF